MTNELTDKQDKLFQDFFDTVPNKMIDTFQHEFDKLVNQPPITELEKCKDCQFTFVNSITLAMLMDSFLTWLEKYGDDADKKYFLMKIKDVLKNHTGVKKVKKETPKKHKAEVLLLKDYFK